MTHTPGPWKVQKTRSNRPITMIMTVDKQGAVICDMNKIGGNDIDADARLIAAAPDLLAACKLALEYTGWHYHAGAQEAHDALKAAIAKAEGTQP